MDVLLQSSDVDLVELFKNAPYLLPPVAIAWIMSKFQNERDKERQDTEAQMHAEYRTQIQTVTDRYAEQVAHLLSVQQEMHNVIRDLTAEIVRRNGQNGHPGDARR